MAASKSKAPASAETPISPPPPLFLAVEALPQLMPAYLSKATQEGWKLITIAARRDSNDHVAYFQRS